MADPTSASSRSRRPSKRRRYYDVGPDFRVGGRAGFVVENLDRLLQGSNSLGPFPGTRGFPALPEFPRLLLDRKLGRALRDLEVFHAYWLISDRMKAALEALDRDAFAFLKCEARVAEGAPVPAYWLCDVLRILDAVDEAASRLKIYFDIETGTKVYNLTGGASLVFKDSIVGPAHVFRMAHLEPAIFCDQMFKDACRAAGLKGVVFRDASDC